MATYRLEITLEDPHPHLGQIIANAVSNGLQEYAGGPEVLRLDVYSAGKLVATERGLG